MKNNKQTWKGIIGIFEQYDVKPMKLISSKELKESGLIEKIDKKILRDLANI